MKKEGVLMTKHKKKNRLIHEKSPYLLQHAHNPVDWYPWSGEAFEKAKKDNKPVFVSIGYSTCHWCHVMEKESFEDAEVASLLNEHFVSIKVDREERPDIDSIYMSVCQMLTGQAGWPLHVFLTPDQKPFHAGTYYPKESKHGKTGLIELLPKVAQIYKEDPDQISTINEELIGAFKDEQTESEEKTIPSDTAYKAYQQLTGNFDTQYGGFGMAPKFPNPVQLMFLLRYYKAKDEPNALNMVEITLDSIARGGIYDHIGSGFARYSTDEMWLVPHFEKMLYDQALLLLVYIEAYQVLEKPPYKEIIYNTIEFIKREMMHPKGGFYSAIDADSEGAEGSYYTWTLPEVVEVLGDKAGYLYAAAYDITVEGNYEGKSIPNLLYADTKALAQGHDLTLDELAERLEDARQLLFSKRQSRTSPHVDDKILTSWNALMIATLAKAGATFSEQKFIDLAVNGLRFIEKQLLKDDKLYARYRDGEAKYEAYLDDYAFLLWALIELHQATGNDGYVEKAKKLAEMLISNFEDTENGGFYFSSHDAEQLFVREKVSFDNVYPSGNGAAAMQLWRLAKITKDEKWMNKVEHIFKAFGDEATQRPTSVLSILNTLLGFSSDSREITITGDTKKEVTNYLRTSFRPFDVWTIQSSASEKLSVEICENKVCHDPLTDLEEIMKKLSQ